MFSFKTSNNKKRVTRQIKSKYTLVCLDKSKYTMLNPSLITGPSIRILFMREQREQIGPHLRHQFAQEHGLENEDEINTNPSLAELYLKFEREIFNEKWDNLTEEDKNGLRGRSEQKRLELLRRYASLGKIVLTDEVRKELKLDSENTKNNDQEVKNKTVKAILEPGLFLEEKKIAVIVEKEEYF